MCLFTCGWKFRLLLATMNKMAMNIQYKSVSRLCLFVCFSGPITRVLLGDMVSVRLTLKETDRLCCQVVILVVHQ